jgi:hypothetical protein
MPNIDIDRIVGELKLVLNKHNIEYKVEKSEITYGFKVNISALDKSMISKINEDNTRLSKHYGFTQNIVGMEFESINNGIKEIHCITGFKTSYRKYPILTKGLVSNSNYKFDPATVKKKLGGDKLINRFSNLDKLL